MMHAVTLVGFKYTTRFGGGSFDNCCSSRFDLHDIHEQACHVARFALHQSLHSSINHYTQAWLCHLWWCNSANRYACDALAKASHDVLHVIDQKIMSHVFAHMLEGEAQLPTAVVFSGAVRSELVRGRTQLRGATPTLVLQLKWLARKKKTRLRNVHTAALIDARNMFVAATRWMSRCLYFF